tara:strand:- start:21340 stop:21660 length:321 start_codon:yes stop_codon:yes gene_type:complete
MIQTIDIPIYKTKILVFNNEETLRRKFPKTKFDIQKDTRGYSCTVDNIHIIYLQEYNIPIITHESLHVCWYILSERGIKCTPDNHEAQAYLLELIVFNVLKNEWNE